MREHLEDKAPYTEVGTLSVPVAFRSEESHVTAVGLGTNNKSRVRSMKLALAVSLCLKTRLDIGRAKERTSSAFSGLLDRLYVQ